MGKKTEQLLNEINRLRSDGLTNREIAQKCGVSPQYVGKLIKVYEENRQSPPEWNYGLSTRVLNCLKRNRIPLDLQVIADSIDQLLCMRGIGDRSLNEIGSVLKSQNIIDDIGDWIEEGRRKQYSRHQTLSESFSYDFPRQYIVPNIFI